MTSDYRLPLLFHGENSHFVKVTPYPRATKGGNVGTKEDGVARSELTFNEPFNRSGFRCNAGFLSFSSAFRRAVTELVCETTPTHRLPLSVVVSSFAFFYARILLFLFGLSISRVGGEHGDFVARIHGWRNHENSTQRKQKERRNDTIGFVFNSILSNCAHPRDLDNIFWTISKARILD